MVKYFLVILIFVSFGLQAQDKSEPFKNQIGLNASHFVLIFNEQVETFDISYRRQLSDNYLLRVGSDLSYSTNQSGLIDVGVRIGLDHKFKSYSHWSFYWGADIHGSFNKINGNNRSLLESGLISHLGIQYFIGKHFSISTEPSFGVFRNDVFEKTFNPISKPSYYEFKFIKLGEIIVSFIF